MRMKNIERFIKQEFKPDIPDVWDKIQSSQINNLRFNNQIKKKGVVSVNNILMRKRSFKILVSALVAVFILAGGSVFYYNRYKNIPIEGIAHAEDLMKGIKGYKVEVPCSFSKEFIDSTSEFSIDMFKQLAKEKNAVYSPTPLYLSLGLILNGAEGQTKTQIEVALTKHGLDQKELNMYYKALIDDLAKNSEGVELDISNSIWYDNNRFKPEKKFLSINKTYYDADAYMLDFDKPDAPEAMNNWINVVTKGKIDKMVDSIDTLDVMYLFSTIYFDGKWEKPFKEKDTFRDAFYVDDNTKVSVDFMKMNNKNLKIVIKETEQAVMLPYKGGRFAFLAILPDEKTNIRDYVSNMTKDSLSDIVEAMQKAEAAISLPKFGIEFEKKLNKELEAMGMTDMLNSLSADFSGMYRGRKSNCYGDNLYVSEVLQKSFIKVDEKSTIAVSAVKISFTIGSAPPPYINFNRPFVYAIYDTKTTLPLFLGILDNPQGNNGDGSVDY